VDCDDRTIGQPNLCLKNRHRGPRFDRDLREPPRPDRQPDRVARAPKLELVGNVVPVTGVREPPPQ
jgi:hypothetical protein